MTWKCGVDLDITQAESYRYGQSLLLFRGSDHAGVDGGCRFDAFDPRAVEKGFSAWCHFCGTGGIVGGTIGRAVITSRAVLGLVRSE